MPEAGSIQADHRVEIAGSGLSSAEIDAIKGVLIVWIALGHNAMLTRLVPGAYQFIYAFHVIGFLLLPFLFQVEPLSWAFARDRAVRYLVPYLAVCIPCSLLYALLGPPGWSPAAIFGLLLGSAHAIKGAMGFELYWFLPCLFSLTLLRALRARLPRHSAWLLLGTAIGVNLALGWVPLALRPFSPFGIATAFFVYPLGLATAWLWHRGRSRRAIAGWVAVAVWAACAAVSYSISSSGNIGRLQVYPIGLPLPWILHNVIPIAAFLTFCSMARHLARVPGLVGLGRNSLIIYLVHSLIMRSQLIAFGLDDRVAALGTGIAVLITTLAISALLASILQSIPPLRRLVLPRDAKEWPVLRPLRAALPER